jgi:hypothetical protein
MSSPNTGNVPLRWSEAVLLGSRFYKHSVPPGLKTDPGFVNRTLETPHLVFSSHYSISNLATEHLPSCSVVLLSVALRSAIGIPRPCDQFIHN